MDSEEVYSAAGVLWEVIRIFIIFLVIFPPWKLAAMGVHSNRHEYKLLLFLKKQTIHSLKRFSSWKGTGVR